jgi:signal transduction histidine kinase
VARVGLFAWVGLCAFSLRAGVVITSVTVDGKEVPREGLKDPAGGGLRPLRVRESARDVVFRFAEDPAVQAPAARLRYKLEGYDTHWIDRPITMRLLLHFYDEKREIVGQKEFFLVGETPGWRGNVEASEYVSRREQFIVPEKAFSLRLAAVSHGGSEGVGLIGIDAVRVTIERTGEAQPNVLDLSIQGSDVARPSGTPANWMREGSSLNIAQLGMRSLPSPHPILVLDDEDNLNYGNWSLDLWKKLELRPGDRLTVEWLTAHSIGGSGSGWASYSSLKPGVYTFRAAGFRSNGEATGAECTLPVVIVPALYRRSEFWLVLAAVAFVVALLSWRAVEVGRMRRRVAKMEREQELERERARIAKDLHDDIGANLSQISILTTLAGRQDAPVEERNGLAEEAAAVARQTIRSFDQIVWSINPRNDTVQSLVQYLCNSAEDLMASTGIRCQLNAEGTFPELALNPQARWAVLMATKEALHNVIKHSGAIRVEVRIGFADGVLEVTVEDDGRGIEEVAAEPSTRLKPVHQQAGESRAAHGNGLRNMRQRMGEVGGECRIGNQPDGGVQVVIRLRVAHE